MSYVRIHWLLAVALTTTSCWVDVGDLDSKKSNEPTNDAAAKAKDDSLSEAGFPHPDSAAADAGVDRLIEADAIVEPPDAGTGDADQAGDDAEVEASPPVVNLVNGGDMENGCAGFSYFATLSSSADAHSGSQACLVCKLGSASTYAINFGNLTQSTTAGQTFSAKAWVRSTASNQAINLRLRNYADGAVVESKSDGPKALTTSWMPLEVTFTLGANGSTLNTYVFVDASPDGACFLIDDLVVTLVSG